MKSIFVIGVVIFSVATGHAKGAMQNPLVGKWTGPHGGVPPFDKVQVAQFKGALEQGMTAELADIERIANDTSPATFENTIVALERAGRTLERVNAIYGVWSSTMNTPDFEKVEREMEPKLAAHRDQIALNAKLFARVAAVYEGRAKLNAEQQRLVWDRYTDLVRAGARLEPAAKKRLSEVNQQLAGLFTDFAQNVLADEKDHMLVIEKEADLAGLPDTLRAGFAATADERGHKGKWVVANGRSSMEPFLTYSSRRDLREKVWRTYYNRGDNGDAKDNNKIIKQILKLRAERAKLLGFETHAHWRLEKTMAKTPARAMELMESVWTPAVARVREEVADMQALATKLEPGAKIKIEPWDYRYYAEKVRKARYDIDQNEVKPYLQLDKLREGMFWVAGELFGFRFSPLTGIPVYHPDVTVYEVKDAAGKHVGLWYFDPYARPGKHSGAWMSQYRNQERFEGAVTTIVSNNANFVKGKAGEPVLISWDDARTLFHEFGHALHGLSSSVNYPSMSGTNVARDYVEFPSQLLEHWMGTPEILNKFALHHKTGKPVPAELIAKLDRASRFNQGFDTVEYLAAALVDMKLHLAGDKDIDPDKFEKDTLKALGMPAEIVMRHRTPQFSHVFGGDGYSAGYYSYLWSDTLSADAFEAFTEGKGAYDKTVAKKLFDHVFSVGNTVDPAEGYRAFRGKDPGTAALMRKRGFPVPAHK
jgi:peptidyl-dipeptidase Dcp